MVVQRMSLKLYRYMQQIVTHQIDSLRRTVDIDVIQISFYVSLITLQHSTSFGKLEINLFKV